jgi:hypothetical protein
MLLATVAVEHPAHLPLLLPAIDDAAARSRLQSSSRRQHDASIRQRIARRNFLTCASRDTRLRTPILMQWLRNSR